MRKSGLIYLHSYVEYMRRECYIKREFVMPDTAGNRETDRSCFRETHSAAGAGRSTPAGAVIADTEALCNFDLSSFDQLLLKPITLEKLDGILNLVKVER